MHPPLPGTLLYPDTVFGDEPNIHPLKPGIQRIPVSAADHHHLVFGNPGEAQKHLSRGFTRDRFLRFCGEGHQGAVVVKEEQPVLAGSVVRDQLVSDGRSDDLFGALDLDRPGVA